MKNIIIYIMVVLPIILFISANNSYSLDRYSKLMNAGREVYDNFSCGECHSALPCEQNTLAGISNKYENPEDLKMFIINNMLDRSTTICYENENNDIALIYLVCYLGSL